MEILMKIERKILILITIGIMMITSNVFAANGRSASIKENITKLHAEVFEVLKKLGKNGEGSMKIHLGGGLHTSLGGRERFIYEERVDIDISSSGITKILFYYTQTNEKNMEDTVSVIFLNENPSDEEFSGLTLKYEATLEKDAEFKYSEVEEKFQYKILVGYRDKLENLIRALGVLYETSVAREKAGLGKVLQIGKEQEDN